MIAFGSLTDTSTFAAAFAPSLLAMIVKSTVVLLVAIVVLRFMRRRAAASRHLFLTLTSASVLLLPLLSVTLPGWSVLPGMRATLDLAEPGRWADTSRAEWDRAAIDASRIPSAAPAAPFVAIRQSSSTASNTAAATPMPGHDVQRTAATADGPRRRDVWAPIQFMLVVVWVFGVAVAALAMSLGAASLWRLRRQSKRLTHGPLVRMLHPLCDQLGIQRNVELYQTARRAIPLTWGTLRPRIVLPDAAEQWSESRRRAVLLHELAHVRRFDCLAQLISHSACVVLWFNPLIWFIRKRMIEERERACDDVVLNSGLRPSDYAQHLLRVVAGVTFRPFTASAAVAMAHTSEMESRIVAILDRTRTRRSPSRKILVLGIAGAIVLSSSLAVVRQAATADEESAKPPVQRAASKLNVTTLGNLPRFGESFPVQDFTISQDGRTLVSTTMTGGKFSAWDLETGKRIATFDNQGISGDVVVMSPDGGLIAVGNDYKAIVRIWDVSTGNELTSFDGLTGAQPRGWHRGSMAFSPDSSILATAGNDGVIRLWRPRSGEPIGSLKGHDRVVPGLEFSGDGKFLYSGGKDGYARHWDVLSGEELNQWEIDAPNPEMLNAIALSRKHDVLAICWYQGVVLHNLATDTSIPVELGEGTHAYTITASPDGEQFALLTATRDMSSREVTSMSIVLLKAQTGERIRQFDNVAMATRKVAITPDGGSVATATMWENRVRFWDINTFKEHHPHTSGHSGGVPSVAFSPDGQTLVSGGSDRTIRLWDVSSGEQTRVIQQDRVKHVAFDPAGKNIASAGTWDDTVRIYDAASGEKRHDLLLGGLREPNLLQQLTPRPDRANQPARKLRVAFGTVGFSQDGEQVFAMGYVPSQQVRIRTWNVENGEKVAAVNYAMGRFETISRLPGRQTFAVPRAQDFSPDGKTAAIGNRRGIYLLSTASRNVQGHIEFPESSVLCLEFLPDGKTLIAATSDGKVHVCDTELLKPTRLVVDLGRPTQFTAMAVSPSGGRLLVMAHVDDAPSVIQIWDTTAWEKSFEREVAERFKYGGFAFAADENRLAVGLRDGTIQIWDLDDSQN